MPIAPTFNGNTDIAIAVNLAGKLISDGEKKVTNIQNKAADNNDISSRVSSYIQKLKNKSEPQKHIDWAAYEIANQAFDAMQSTIARQKLAAYPPDLSIEISRNACGTLEFDRANEMIALGYSKAQESLL